MTTAKIHITDAISLALAAIATYQRKLKGIPEIDEEKLHRAIHIVQKGVDPTGLMVTEAQAREAHGIAREENMRRGLERCVQRANELVEFFHFVRDSDPRNEHAVSLSFDDFVFLAKADTASEKDFR